MQYLCWGTIKKAGGTSAIVGITVILALCIAIFGLLESPVQAAQVTLRIHGGPLDFTIQKQAGLVPDEAASPNQDRHGSLGPIGVRDARGRGAGWSLVAQATDFISGNNDYAIPAGRLHVNGAARVTTLAGNTAPRNFGGPLKAPLKLLSAGPGAGMGSFQIEPLVALDMPADTPAERYDSTLTLTLISGS